MLLTLSLFSKRSFLKQVVSLFLLTGSLFLLATAVAAQEGARSAPAPKKQMQSSPKDAPSAILAEFNAIVSKYDLSTDKGKKNFISKITDADRATLESLYKRMSKKQQLQQVAGFMPNVAPPPEVVPTDKQLEEWENGGSYEVWIDGKKVNNAVLKDYSNSDFSRTSMSKGLKSGKRYFKVDLMTKGYYNETYDQQISNKGRSILFVR